jgi:predicted dehydrogenase
MVKVGIIGCGKIAQVRHIPEYCANKEVQIVGFFDNVFARAQEMAVKYGGKAYASVDELLADPSIDSVSVCVPNFLHAAISLKAMKARKNVLCEKPMAVTLEDCIEMAKVSEETGCLLMIGQNQRLLPAHQMAKKLIEGGEIGNILSIRTAFAHSGPDNWSVDGKNSWFLDKSKAAFGALADLGVHKIDLMSWLIGQKIVKAAAITRTLDKKYPDGKLIDVDDNAFCCFQFDKGAEGTLFASWTNYGSEENWTSIYGTSGAIHLFKDNDHSLVVEHGANKKCFDLGEIQTNNKQLSSGIIDMFVAAVAHGKPYISGSDVLSSMKALFACSKSVTDGNRMEDVVL